MECESTLRIVVVARQQEEDAEPAGKVKSRALKRDTLLIVERQQGVHYWGF